MRGQVIILSYTSISTISCSLYVSLWTRVGSMEVVSTFLCGKSYFLDMAKLYFTMDILLDV
jgi:hypothetical protein